PQRTSDRVDDRVTGEYLPPPGDDADWSWPAPPPLPPPRPAPVHRPRWGLALTLLASTFVTTTILGAVWVLWAHPTDTVPVNPWLSPNTLRWVWNQPQVLLLGLSFSLPALFILLCHEMGHYLACRRYGLPATLPYFLPLPLGIGTLGAFIRIRGAIESRRQLFDVGVAGPIAGFVALVPFLILGVARSEVVPVDALTSAEVAALPLDYVGPVLFQTGHCLAIDFVASIFHGPLPENTVLHLHPFALAAWFGLLVTAMNLLPLAQLDGGHVLYAAAGNWQRKLAPYLWLGLVGAGFFWPGWWLWCVIVLLMGLRHPPVRDESTRLDGRRLALAWLALAILVVSFMPSPVEQLFLRL
ncbi:MAG TPA: site-2 protease family protein, partial [Thermoanaerobaculia bacterium]|nr:site-2 protease family protein [Thermoanaerobaculia bacterium]